MSAVSAVTETPIKQSTQIAKLNNANMISLPPLSSILLSPAESSLRNSLIQENNNTKSNIFNLKPSATSSGLRTFSLPSIDNLTTTTAASAAVSNISTTSPTFKRQVSFSNSLPLPTSSLSHTSTTIPATPLTHKMTLTPMFTQSTPLHVTRKQNILPPVPKISSAVDNDSSFYHSTPFKTNNTSTFNTPLLSAGSSMALNSTDILSSKKSLNDSSMKLGNTSSAFLITPSTSMSSTSSTSSRKRKASIDDSKSFAFISHSQETFLLNEPNIDNARLARRKRRRTSPTELSILKSEFKKGTTPNKQRRILIAKMVDMTEKAVQIWFQNRRQAMRKFQTQNSRRFIVELGDSFKKQPEVEDEEDILDEDVELNSSSNNSDADIELDTSANKENNISKSQEIFTDANSTTATDVDINDKENIDPLSNSPSKHSLPPRGIFSSPLSSKKINKKITVLSDITNQANNQQSISSNCQTFKFKSTNFGLINHNIAISRRQKPTMKLKLKSGFGNSNKPEIKHQGIVILNDQQNSNTNN